jgi:hypothetical protein
LSEKSGELSFGAVVELWRDSAEFREYFINLISGSSFDAFFWETPPVTELTVCRRFEFVLVQASSLSRLSPDPAPFIPHFSTHPSEAVLTFPNLGGDAILIVPAPLAGARCYTHLAAFVRSAPRSQVDAFWCIVGHAMGQRISSHPIWLSTAGMGVSWLHLRLDSRPKYYRHEPYTIHS